MLIRVNTDSIHANFCRGAKQLFRIGKKINGRAKVQVTGHMSLVIVLPIQEVSQTLLKANLWTKNFCLGLIRPKVSFYKCLGYFLYW